MKFNSFIYSIVSDKDQAWKLILEIERIYEDHRRNYHNIDHINFMFENLDKYFPSMKNDKVLKLAIVFHDLEYFCDQPEFKSYLKGIELAKKYNIQLSIEEKNELFALITNDNVERTHNIKRKKEILDDLDYLILATSPREYEQYAIKIRREYKDRSLFIFKFFRKRFLKKLLKKKDIFKTSEIRSMESLARHNIKNEINNNINYEKSLNDNTYRNWTLFDLLSFVYLDTDFSGPNDRFDYYAELKRRRIYYPIRKLLHLFIFPGLIWNIFWWEWVGFTYLDVIWGYTHTMFLIGFILLLFKFYTLGLILMLSPFLIILCLKMVNND